jgi:hypothetical protein
MEQIRVKNEVGYISLVGIVADKYPVEYGNYFSLGGYHVLNMWHENFEHLNINKPYLDAVKFGDHHIAIVDEDIPDDYLNDSPCFTGGKGMTQEDYKEVYELMYPRYKELKCMCCESAKYVSVNKHSWTTETVGIRLAQGTCRICRREVLMNNNSEINKEVYDKLRQIQKEAPSESGLYVAPHRMKTKDAMIIEAGAVYAPNPALLSRYANKEVNKDFYGMVKISDLKEQSNNEEDEKL